METVLRIQNINKHYPGFALENVSFSLAPNRIMGLIGKNGAGKSTTLKQFSTWCPQKAGASPCFKKIFISMKKSASNESVSYLAGLTFTR